MKFIPFLLLAWALAAGEPPTTREDFLRELFAAQPTALLPRFDGNPNGYNLNKPDLPPAVRAYARDQKLEVVALIITGPFRPLHVFNVVLFLRDNLAPGQLRVNRLLYPDFRLTRKTTLLIPEEKAAGYLDRLLANPRLAAGLPGESSRPVVEGEELARLLEEDENYLVLVDWRKEPERLLRLPRKTAGMEELRPLMEELARFLAPSEVVFAEENREPASTGGGPALDHRP